MRKVLNICCLLAWLVSAAGTKGFSATNIAASVSKSAVQAVIDASSDGDTVVIPAGSATWNGEVTLSGKRLNIFGAGIGQTIIANGAWDMTTAGKLQQLFNLTMSGRPSGSSTILYVENTVRNGFGHRISHVRFDDAMNSIGQHIIWLVDTHCLIDNCQFRNTGANGQGITIDTGGAQAAITNFNYVQTYGDTNTVVIEDCVFDFADLGDGAVDAYPGVKFVFRYNLVTNTVVAWHGEDSSSRAPRLWEVYKNNFYTRNGINPYVAIRSRGGTGVVWSNTIASGSGYGAWFNISHYRADPAYGAKPGQSYDGNFDLKYPGAGYATGYPLRGQAGWGSFPNAPSGSYPWDGNDPNCSGAGCTTNAWQQYEPVYQWGNNDRGNTSPTIYVGNPAQSVNYIKPNRDYFDNVAKPGYTPLVYPHPLRGASVAQAPTISDIGNQFTTISTPTAAIPFTINDADTPVGNLTLVGSSSNPTLVPVSNIVFGGSGSSRTVTVTPAAGQSGTALITVTVSDGTNNASDPFVLTVGTANTAPTISVILAQTINEDTSTGPLNFGVGDAETGAASLTLTKASSNPTLVPSGNIVLGGNGANRTVTVSPAANQSGSATITLSVSDGQLSTSTSFVVTVNSVNDTPTITVIANQTISPNGTTGPLSFTVGDAETAAGSLPVTRASSNPTLVPTANVVLGGSGSARTVTVTPASGQSGTTTITLSVSDGQLSANASFVLNVAAGVLYYVDNGSPAASDSPSNGSEAQPWRTVNYAMSRIAAGNTVLVKNGTYNEDGLYIYGPSGSPGAETTLKAYPGHNPLFRGLGNTGRIAIDGVSYLTIDGLDIANINQAIQIRNVSHHITIRNCNIHNTGQEAVRVMDNSHDVLIESNTIHDTTTLGNPFNGEGVYVGSSLGNNPSDFCYNVTIRRNTIYNTYSEGVELKHGAHDCIVEGNNISASNTGTVPAASIEVDESVYGGNPNHVVRNNFVHDSGNYSHGIRAGTDCLIYNNVVYNIASGKYAVMVDNVASDSYTRRIYHNTLDVPLARAIQLGGGAADVRNNIGPSTANNLVASVAYFVNAASRDYHLVAGSAPVDAGVDLSSIVPVDLDGRSRPNGNSSDIGAFEYASGGQPAAPQNLRVATSSP